MNLNSVLKIQYCILKFLWFLLSPTVMHGGLFAQDNVTLDDLRQIERNRQPPEEGLMCDL